MAKKKPAQRARKRVKPSTAETTAAPPAPPKAKARRSQTPTASIEGLKRPQVRVLEALMDGSSLTRAEIAEKAKVDNATLTGYLGSTDPAIRAKNDEEWHPSLITMKMVRFKIVDEDGKDVPRYEIMALGKRKIEKALKEMEA